MGTRLDEVRRHFHQRETANLEPQAVSKVPSLVEMVPEGFRITMIDGWGQHVEMVYLDYQENVLRRVPINRAGDAIEAL